VLVCLGDRKNILEAIRNTFSDVLPCTAQFILQIKNENWGGDFLDISKSGEVPDRSVLKVRILNEVGVERQDFAEEIQS